MSFDKVVNADDMTQPGIICWDEEQLSANPACVQLPAFKTRESMLSDSRTQECMKKDWMSASVKDTVLHNNVHWTICTLPYV